MCSIDEKIARVNQVFHDLDEDTAAFRRACGLECLVACGDCCKNPMIAATEDEMLPMAAFLLKTGKASRFYASAEVRGFEGPCVFFQSGTETSEPGHCAAYAYRPLVCRLFSASASRDKSGKMRLVMCRPIKETFANVFLQASADVSSGSLKAPVTTDHVMRLAGAGCGSEILPVNMAFKKAFERLSLTESLRGEKFPRC